MFCAQKIYTGIAGNFHGHGSWPPRNFSHENVGVVYRNACVAGHEVKQNFYSRNHGVWVERIFIIINFYFSLFLVCLWRPTLWCVVMRTPFGTKWTSDHCLISSWYVHHNYSMSATNEMHGCVSRVDHLLRFSKGYGKCIRLRINHLQILLS